MSALRAMIACGLLLVSAMAGCSATDQPAHGELMVALSSDMSIPKDVTHLRIDILVNAAVAYQYDFQIAPDGEFHLPGTLAIVAGKTESPIVSVEVIGIREGANGHKQARTFSKVVTTVPKSRIALLRVPVQWLCDQSALDLGDDSFASTCDPVNGQETACAAGSCAPVALDEAQLTTFAAQAVFGGGSGPDSGECFDTVTCLAPGQDVVPAADCSLVVPDGSAPLNVGIVLAPGGDGICPTDATADCFVPLDQDARLGWHFRDPSATSSRVIELPPAVCTALSMGRAKALRLSASCPSKLAQTPTCGPWSSVPTSLTDGGVLGDSGAPDSGTPDSGPDASNPDASKADASNPDASPAEGGSMSDGRAPPPGCTDPLSFTDPTLETAVRAAIGIAAPTPITASAAGAVQSLDLTGKSLTTVDGVQCFPNLLFLTLTSNQLSDVTPLSTLTGVTRLDLSFNPLSDVTPLAALTGLTLLELMNDQIVDPSPLAALTGLTSLDLPSNRIQDPSSLAALTNLTFLGLDGNQITPATLVSLLASLGKIQDLRLSNSGLSDLTDIGKMTSLTSLVLIGNGIQSLAPLANLTQLKFLDLNGNSITDLSPIAALPITDLHLSQNPLTSLAGVAGFTGLTGLDASNLQLSAPSEDLALIASLSQLTSLFLNTDGLTDISQLAALDNLQQLSIGGNSISDISALQGLTNLNMADVSNNLLTTLSPLVNNTGIGAGDSVRAQGNMLDCTAEAANLSALRAAGVMLSTDCP